MLQQFENLAVGSYELRIMNYEITNYELFFNYQIDKNTRYFIISLPNKRLKQFQVSGFIITE
jgi:hypothetical protein